MNGFQKVVKVCAICLAIFIISNIFMFIVSELSLMNYFTKQEESVNSAKEFVQTYTNIERLDIDLIASNITIKQGTEFKVEASTTGTLSSKVINGKLKLEETKKWFIQNNYIGEVTVYIPTTLVLKELDLDAGAGTVKIEDITAEKVDLDQGAGVFKIEKCNFNKTDIDGGAGKVEIISSKLNNLDLDCGAGKVELEAQITGDSKVSAGIGEIDIILIGTEEDYKINAEKGIGSIKIDGKECNSNTTYGTGHNRINIDGGIGAIYIQFKEGLEE